MVPCEEERDALGIAFDRDVVLSDMRCFVSILALMATGCIAPGPSALASWPTPADDDPAGPASKLTAVIVPEVVASVRIDPSACGGLLDASVRANAPVDWLWIADVDGSTEWWGPQAPARVENLYQVMMADCRDTNVAVILFERVEAGPPSEVAWQHWEKPWPWLGDWWADYNAMWWMRRHDLRVSIIASNDEYQFVDVEELQRTVEQCLIADEGATQGAP